MVSTRASYEEYECLYNCDVCDFGDYDLCHRCFIEGEYCRNKTHLLGKFKLMGRENKDFIKPLKYYSCVKDDGRQEEFVSN
jgi:hypothetical protein